MAIHLLMGSTKDNLRLPPGTDVEATSLALAEATASGSAVKIQAELGDDPRGVFSAYVNPSRLTWWSIIEVSEPD